MRVAAAVIGGLGTVLGAMKGLFFVVATLLLMVRLGERGLNFYYFLEIGTEFALAVSCLLGATGAGLVLTRRRLRAGALLMLVGAAGVAVAGVAFGLLLPLTQPPDYRAVSSIFTNGGFYLLYFFPVPFLLVGAVLAFVARRASAREAA